MSAGEVPKAGPLERKQLSFIAAAGWTACSMFALALAIKFTDDARPGAKNDLVNQTACALFVYSALILAMLRVYEPTTRMRDVLAVRPTSIVGTLLAIVSGAAFYPAIYTIDYLVTRRFPLEAEELEVLTKLSDMSTLGQRIVVIVSAVLVSPLCEGFFFFGVLYGGLRRGRISLLAVLGTTAFYAMFREPRAYASMLLVGLLLSWFRSRSGSVVPAILANMGLVLVPVVLTFTPYNAMETFPWRWVAIGVGVGITSTLLAILFFTRNEKALTGRLADG